MKSTLIALCFFICGLVHAAPENWLKDACEFTGKRSELQSTLSLVTFFKGTFNISFDLYCSKIPSLIMTKEKYLSNGKSARQVTRAKVLYNPKNDLVVFSSGDWKLSFIVPAEEMTTQSEETVIVNGVEQPTGKTIEKKFGRKWVIMKHLFGPMIIPGTEDAPDLGCVLSNGGQTTAISLDNCRFMSQVLYLDRGSLNGVTVDDDDFVFGKQYDYRAMFKSLAGLSK